VAAPERTCVRRPSPSTLHALGTRAVCAPLTLVALQGEAVVSGVGFRSRNDAEVCCSCGGHRSAARKFQRLHSRACQGALVQPQLSRERVGAAHGQTEVTGRVGVGTWVGVGAAATFRREGTGPGESILDDLPLRWHGYRCDLSACHAAKRLAVTAGRFTRIVRART